MTLERFMRYLMIAIALGSLIGLIVTGLALVDVEKWFGQDEIVRVIHHYLTGSEHQARNDLVKLMELEALMVPLQHSVVGISFLVDIQVGVGQMMASFTHLLAEAIVVTLSLISTIEVLRVILDFSEMATPWVWIALLFSGILFGFSHSVIENRGWLTTLGRRSIKLTLGLFLLLHILVPYALYGSAILSKHLLAETKQSSALFLEHLHQQSGAQHKKADMKTRAEAVVDTFEKVTLDLTHRVEGMAVYHTRHIASSLLEFILFPLMALAALTGGIWLLIRTDIRNL